MRNVSNVACPPEIGVCTPRRAASQAGLTLLELLIVIVILGLLAATAGPPLARYLSRAKTDTAKLQMEQIQTSLDLFRLDLGRYPTQEEGLGALAERPANAGKWAGPYVKN